MALTKLGTQNELGRNVAYERRGQTGCTLQDFQHLVRFPYQHRGCDPKEPKAGEREVDLVILTNVAKESVMNDAMRRLESDDAIAGSIARIRVEHLD